MSADVNDELTQQLNALLGEVKEVKSALYGPERTPYFGLLPRVEQAEEKIRALQSIQDTFVADQERENQAQAKREQVRSRVIVVVLTTFGAVLSGIVVQLFVLIFGGP